ncbi:MAG: hypothetical protein HOO96_00690 [Polyangiaceae bacterium]|nr:hypothetical protein [Polyangiaceae bacterium]
MAGSSRRRILWAAGTAAALATTALVACTLNPQPLPPEAMNPGEGKDGDYDASARSDAGGTGFDRDAATQPPAADAATDAADAGDAGDAADAGDASDADAW